MSYSKLKQRIGGQNRSCLRGLVLKGGERMRGEGEGG
jgi:hypothetical protein